MAKKTKPSKQKQKKSLQTTPSQADKLLDLIGQQIVQQDYQGAVTNCERLLNYLPQSSPLCADVLTQLGIAQGMLQNFAQSYAALTKALELTPNNAEIWYNRGMASRFTSRFGRSLRDYQRAAELNTLSELSKQLDEAIEDSRSLVEDSLKMRGPGFTLDQLIEQEDLFQQGLTLMEANKWDAAAQAFHASIAMGDCLPQPWGNLGACYLMQEHYDEAEAAWERALVIEPTYAIAQQNLERLPGWRRNGPPQQFGINEPFKNIKLNQSISFLAER